jgi:predicted enzyme related to lactoylglutathione lyase
MTCALVALSFDAHDPARLARFWSGVLGWRHDERRGDGVVLRPVDDTGFALRFVPGAEPKTAANRMHFDLTSTSTDDQQRTVTRSLELGARHIDVGQRPEEGHVVLADPEGNEFCVVEPGNRFLADCGFVGAVSCDGSQQVGYFWSEALGWPLIWDQDEETGIRSPHGGPKITWGGPPVAPKAGRNRLQFDVAPTGEGGGPAEVERLLGLGATRLEDGDGERVVLSDPDGNEFDILMSTSS